MQVFEGMLLSGAEEWQLLVALLHDTGKTLSLTGEPDEHVDGSNLVLDCPYEGAGLDNCLLTYSHDEFGYMKLDSVLHADLPFREEILYAVRFHSLHEVEDKWLSEKDRRMFPWLFRVFHVFDHGTKNPARIPNLQIFHKARDLIGKYFGEEKFCW